MSPVVRVLVFHQWRRWGSGSWLIPLQERKKSASDWPGNKAAEWNSQFCWRWCLNTFTLSSSGALSAHPELWKTFKKTRRFCVRANMFCFAPQKGAKGDVTVVVKCAAIHFSHNKVSYQCAWLLALGSNQVVWAFEAIYGDEEQHCGATCCC